MLAKLTIQNLAVVDDVSLTFAPGLNILSGSTGAGKSLILGAVNLLLGEKASASLIREGEDLAVVEGVLRSAGPRRASADTVLRREVKRSGRSQAFVDGRVVTAAELRAVARGFIEPHGQNEQFRLKDPETHLHYVDAFAGNEAELLRYRRAYEGWREASVRLRDFERRVSALKEKQELLLHRVEEIDRAAIEKGEMTVLSDRVRLLENSERVFSLLAGVQGLLDGDDADIAGVASALGQAVKQIESIADVDARVEMMSDTLAGARIAVDECSAEIRRFIDGFEFDPDELARSQERIAFLVELERRYGMPADDILAARETWRAELEGVAFEDDERRNLEADVARSGGLLAKAAAALTASRRAAAKKLDQRMTRELRGLLIKGAEFRTELTFTRATDGPVTVEGAPVEATETGCDAVRFHIRTNVGEAAGPVDEIASTGELSRVALALKGVTGTSNPGSVLVFDEIDAGVGADLGALIAQKLLALSEHYQIICITHLPQIAARGDNHLVVSKSAAGGRTAVGVSAVSGPDRRREIARMLGGEEGSDRRMALADELLSQRNETTKTRVRP